MASRWWSSGAGSIWRSGTPSRLWGCLLASSFCLFCRRFLWLITGSSRSLSGSKDARRSTPSLKVRGARLAQVDSSHQSYCQGFPKLCSQCKTTFPRSLELQSCDILGLRWRC
jgi:hypothetical protein